MADTDRSDDESTGLFKGIAFTILMILGAALCNDASFNTQGISRIAQTRANE